ncbi:YqcI/YcgG family protein [Natrinema sp. 74]|uniref:YqcI/YcgG family protein n=1 Tax=Natrinema sp. 74 TaxID=3384159 RepID=UPI0038D38F9A
MELLERDRLEERLAAGELADWKATRYRTFRETMTDEAAPYPCYFAVEAQRKGDFRYVFPESPIDEEALAELVEPLTEFLERYERFGEYPSLVVLFRPPEEDPAVADEPSTEAYKRQFWSVLRYLQANDPEPWPASVPTDPDHPKWQYCFAGEPTFLVGRAPFYERRRSRFTPHGLEITVQPWGIFEGLTGLDDDGQEARTIIRDRLAAYDDVEMHPDAGDFVDSRKREWKQYMLPETNAESVARCPLYERTDVEGSRRDR